MIENLTIRPSWIPTNDWNSHRYLLYIASVRTFCPFTEIGCGGGSTPFLKEWCDNMSRKFRSYETNPEYHERYEDEGVTLVENYDDVPERVIKDAVVFIDCAPGEIRKDLIARYAQLAHIIIVHDTEPGSNYVYAMEEALSAFKYRCDCIIDGMPQTTAVSNVFDFKEWKGDYKHFKLV